MIENNSAPLEAKGRQHSPVHPSVSVISSVGQTTMLCQSCEALIRSLDLSRDQELDFHSSIDKLHSGSESGCHLCRIIYTDFRSQHGNELLNRQCRLLCKTVANKGFMVHFVNEADKSSRGKTAEVKVRVGLDHLDPPQKVGQVLAKIQTLDDLHTGSEPAFAIASSWLAECLENHLHCITSSSAPALLPSRVIDVGSQHGSSPPYLLETARKIKGNYATLSHCWGGGNDPVKTTIENLQLHKSELPMKKLPRTFLDAIQVVRELGIQYLWIDSLCIVQNDVKDWENEAGVMGQYYNKSLVTIAAANGGNGESGLFACRDGLSIHPCELLVRSTSRHLEVLQRVYAYAVDTSFQISKSSLSQAYKPLRLYSRAWVLQEQLLSPRVLTYSNSGISWRCQTMRFDERAPFSMSIESFLNDRPGNLVSQRGDPREVESMIADFQRNWIFPKRISGNKRGLEKGTTEFFHRYDCDLHEESHFMKDWARIVEDYTSRGMTYQTDKFAAIRGVATVVAALKSIKYTAGIWDDSEESIIKSLLWHSSKTRNRLMHVSPSWSWASVDGEVHWLALSHVNTQVGAKLIHFKCSETVATCQGMIVLRANARVGVVGNDGKIQIARWPERPTDSKSATDFATIFSVDPSLHWQKIIVSLDVKLKPDTIIYFAELMSGQIPVRRTQHVVSSLVLVEDEAKKGQMLRVGLSTWDRGFWAKPRLDDLGVKEETSENEVLELRSLEFTVV